MDTLKLRSIMALHKDNGSTLSTKLGISKQRFSAKITQKNGAQFVQSEIKAIKDRYKLSSDEIDNIFFS